MPKHFEGAGKRWKGRLRDWNALRQANSAIENCVLNIKIYKIYYTLSIVLIITLMGMKTNIFLQLWLAICRAFVRVLRRDVAHNIHTFNKIWAINIMRINHIALNIRMHGSKLRIMLSPHCEISMFGYIRFNNSADL